MEGRNDDSNISRSEARNLWYGYGPQTAECEEIYDEAYVAIQTSKCQYRHHNESEGKDGL